MRKQSFLLALLLFCVAGSFFASYQASKPVSISDVAFEVNGKLAGFMQEVDEESNRVISDLRKGKSLSSTQTSFVVINYDSISEWNDYHFTPPTSVLLDSFEVKFQKTGAGEFLFKKWKVIDKKFLIAIIPLHVQYRIDNKYLTPSWSEKIFRHTNIVLSEPTEQNGMPIALSNSPLFKIDYVKDEAQAVSVFWQLVTILLGSGGIVVFFLLVNRSFTRFSERYPDLGFVLLTLQICLLRAVMILLGFPARFTDSALFDARNFASSDMNPSLGDLLLNSISVLIICLYLFRNYYRFRLFQYLLSNRLSKFLLSILCVACVLFATLYPFVVTQTIYNNSTIALSITQSLHFDVLRIIGLLIVLLAWVSSFFFMHAFLRVFAHEKRTWVLSISIVIGSLLFIEVNILTGQVYFWSFVSGLAYLIIVLVFSLYNALQRFQYRTFIYFFVTVLCLGFNGMHAVHYFEQQGNVQNQLRFAENFLDERDYFGEYLLHDAAERIASDAFIQTRISMPFLGKEAVTQKIKQIYLSGYFNRYTVQVSLFDVSGNPIESLDSAAFSTLINKYDRETFKTDYERVYYVTTAEGDFSRKYVVFVPLLKNGMKAGYVVIELLLKRIIPENVYPELLVDDRFQQNLHEQMLSYAVALNERVEYSAGEFNYDLLVQSRLGDPRLYTRGIIEDKYLHVALEDSNGRISIISSPVSPVVHWLADFSFQVVLGLVIILILLIFQGLYNLSKPGKLYLAARIQLILNFAFFLPLIIVSVITLNLTSKSSQEQLNSDFLSKANKFGEVVAVELHDNQYDFNEFERRFTNLTTLANLDANVFYPNGKLMTTSQPLIFENQLLAPYIKPSAYKRILKGDKIFVSTERVGSLQFYVAYSALVSPDTGEQLGILAVPFFQSASSLEHLQITVIANILSIFTLVFIVLLTISFLVTKWLTAPLKIITRTVGKISLTGANQPLEWESDDEIGLMAKEYNQMLIKLNDSKQELERNQREKAWREIAQQVAHEIKNPLTPMKLTLQQLERSIQGGEQKDDKLNRAVNSLLSQVNSLDDIASSFSSFAKMPEPVMKEVELVNLLTKAIDLHHQEALVKFQPALERASVLADEKLLSRVFSNIILNSIQASKPGVSPVIQIHIELDQLNYKISFSDNGRGIESNLAEKIFLPHFTTKQSGSGLGLAISKQGIEQMGGKIWFQTSDTGTTFFIELPVLTKD